METQRLYYTDSYLTSFEAQVVAVQPVSGRFHVYLDRTAFYPDSGGQPADRGHIGRAAVQEVLDEGERIAHVVAESVAEGPVKCEIDWSRRQDHMQQHSGQHLLSAAFVEQLGHATVSFHLGPQSSTIDLAAASLSPSEIESVETRSNALVFENRPVTVRFYSPEEVATIGLRKPSDREDLVRVVEIEGLDRSACGGTHVRATGEIGPILIRRLDRIRQSVRVEFLCGLRATKQARADYSALAGAAQLLSSPLDQVPALVAAQIDAAKVADKERQKLKAEIASTKGVELYRTIPPDERGLRIRQQVDPNGQMEQWRAVAQAYASAGPGAVFMIASGQPPAILLALSSDVGADAGSIVKSLAASLGGRGGGSARLAQASLPQADLIPQALDFILQKLPRSK